MAPRGQPYVPSQEQREQVTTMGGLGLPHEQIARILGINKTTLYKHYREELDLGLARGNVAIARSLYDQAVGRPAEFKGNRRVKDELKPDRSVAIFLGKARLGLRDAVYEGVSLEDLDLTVLDDKESAQLERLLRKAWRKNKDKGGDAPDA